MRSADQPRVKQEVCARVLEGALARCAAGGPSLDEVVNESIYHELERLKQGTHGVHDGDDLTFYRDLRRRLPHASSSAQRAMIQQVVTRYTDEICGNFDPKVYAAATKMAPTLFTALLNGMSPGRILAGVERLKRGRGLAPPAHGGAAGALPGLDDHIVLDGATERAKALHRKGRLVFVPTHSSNLDSILMGYAIFRGGLPPAVYGAGLNLFSNRLIGYFMRNLGAYTVDRRKRDPLYKAALKEYATVVLEVGYDALFFPGGTRARSGAVEKRLKKGLLGTTLRAWANLAAEGGDRRGVYLVPCTISYPLVLEASTLIEDYLKEAGKARYIIVDDEFSRWRRWVDFMRGLFNLDARIHVTLGEPLDPFGNDVDEEGRSLDPRGRVIDATRYLTVDGAIAPDPVRDAEYTSALAGRLVERFHEGNTIVATNLVAFAVFELLWRRQRPRDVYRFLRELGPEVSLPMAEVEAEIDALLEELCALRDAGRVRLGPVVGGGDVGRIVRRALASFGTYHTSNVVERRGARLFVGDANLLFYYRNRLTGYALRGVPDRLWHRGSG